MSDYEIEEPKTQNFLEIIGSTGKMLAIMKPDGKVEFGPDYDPDETARIFWAAMETWGFHQVNEKINELKLEIEKLRQFLSLRYWEHRTLLDIYDNKESK